MDNKKLPLLPVKSDFVFKQIFGDIRYIDVLEKFLLAVLEIPHSEYDGLTIIDPFVKKEFDNDKYVVLDVKLRTTSGYVLDIEIQVLPIPEMTERIVYYQSKMVTEQLKSGYKWEKIKRTISIIIADFELVPQNNDYHNRILLRLADGIPWTNLIEINTLELRKHPDYTDNTELWDWLQFIKTEDEEVLEMLQTKSPEIKKAIGRLKELSADEETRLIYEAYEKARHDEISRISGAKKEGLQEATDAIARKMLEDSKPLDEIIKYTGLTAEEILSL